MNQHHPQDSFGHKVVQFNQYFGISILLSSLKSSAVSMMQHFAKSEYSLILNPRYETNMYNSRDIVIHGLKLIDQTFTLYTEKSLC